MTKIYEALQRAENERAAPPRHENVISAGEKSMEEKLLALSHQIEMRLSGLQGGKVVQFVGVQQGENSSRIAYEFAKLMAFRLNKKVLLMAAGPFPYMRGVFSGESAQKWEEMLRNGGLGGEVAHPIEETGTALSLATASHLALPTVFASSESRDSFEDLRNRYDFILIDAPPLPQSLNAGFMSAWADGVVLVVESEKVRWQVVKHCIEQIKSQNGRVLGIAIDGKRYYIPRIVYRLLFQR
jgi:Mrp family chromosome partitioning ATPase